MKEIIPHKLVISYNDKGEIKESILQYRLQIDGATKNEFFTISVKDGIKNTINPILADAKNHAKKGEKIS